METRIAYLKQTLEDLLEAAWRESLGQEIGGRRFRAERSRAYRPRGRGWKVALVAASLVTFLGVAGVIGYVVGGRGDAASPAAPASPGPLGPSDERPFQEEAYAVGGDIARRSLLTDETDSLAAFIGKALPQAAPEGVTNVPTVPELGGGARIIKTAELAIVVEDGGFDDAWQAATDVATANGGFVEESTKRGTRAGTVSIRVPAKRFEESLQALRDLGIRVDRETVRGRDVSAEYVDLHARLDIAKIRRDVLRGLMEDATSISQTIHLQNALDEVQLRIEQFQGSLNLLNDKTKYASLRVSIREKSVEPEPEVENPSLGLAVKRSIAGFFGVLATVMVGLGYLVPIAVVLVVLWFVVRVVRRRRAA